MSKMVKDLLGDLGKVYRTFGDVPVVMVTKDGVRGFRKISFLEFPKELRETVGLEEPQVLALFTEDAGDFTTTKIREGDEGHMVSQL